MATPKANNYFASLYDFCGVKIREYVNEHFSPNMDIVDLGAGWGKYAALLPNYHMDAVEVWTPYILDCQLSDKYRRVFSCDIREWKPEKHYHAAIFGDSFEHLSAEDARAVLNRLSPMIGTFILGIPYEMVQKPVEGNAFEEHLQPDLTPEVMQERYPELEEIARENNRAVYVSRRKA